jgi:hypothetical protein
MLRTMITETSFEQRWVLQGRLRNQWAADLKERWESTRSTREGRKCTIDLEDDFGGCKWRRCTARDGRLKEQRCSPPEPT